MSESDPTRAAPQPEMALLVNPLVIMHELDDGTVACAIHRSARVDRYEAYGLMVCDLVRHVARAFNVTEDAVWEWVDRERAKPTTDITKPS